MENIQRNLEKDVVTFTPPKFSERPESWSFMLVGSYGQVIHLRWLRGLIFSCVFLLIAAIASASYFYFLYRSTLEENRRLSAALNTPSQQVKPSQAEKKTLADKKPLIADKAKTEDRLVKMPVKPPPKVVPAEPSPKTPAKPSSKMPAEPSPNVPGEPSPNVPGEPSPKMPGEPSSSVSAETPSPETPDKADVKVKEDDKPEAVKAVPPADEKVIPGKDDVKPTEENAKPEADDVKKEAVVVGKKAEEEKVSVQPEEKTDAEINDFKISYIKRRRTLNVQFVIRNTGPSRISGHAIVVLKSDKVRRSRWVTLPPVKLTSGKPSGEEIGKTFSISNFKTLKFSAKKQRSPKRFKTAAVFIFAETGKLMLKKDFPIEMD